MYTMFAGFAISLGYGLSASFLLYLIHGLGDAQLFFKAYMSSFHTVFSLGLILGTALIVGRTQRLIPETIEAAFRPEELEKTRYPHFKARFGNRRQSIIWSSELALASFLVFLLCKFPLPLLAENLMILAACAEYAFGVYVGRKLFYSALMLESLLEIKVNRNLFKNQELGIIDEYVHIASTLTFVFGAIHLHNYYFGPFSFQGVLGESARVLVLLPAIIGTPVLLIFNFYPRRVLRRIYSESIDVEIRNLERRLRDQTLDTFQRMSYVIEFEKQSRDELRYRLRLTLADLPIGITLLITLLASLLRSSVRLGP
jgi:hypothetical protein